MRAEYLEQQKAEFADQRMLLVQVSLLLFFLYLSPLFLSCSLLFRARSLAFFILCACSLHRFAFAVVCGARGFCLVIYHLCVFIWSLCSQAESLAAQLADAKSELARLQLLRTSGVCVMCARVQLCL